MITDAKGIPLAVRLTGANRHDLTQLLPLVDAIKPVRGKPGRPRKRPDAVQGDRGYDSEPHRKELRRRGIEPILAKRNTEHGSGLGVFRWPVERTLLTTGALDALLVSRARGGNKMNTPWLHIEYQCDWQWKQPPPPPKNRPLNGQ